MPSISFGGNSQLLFSGRFFDGLTFTSVIKGLTEAPGRDLKSLGRKGCAGSTPAVRTSQLDLGAGLLRTAPMTTQRTPQRLTSPKDLARSGAGRAGTASGSSRPSPGGTRSAFRRRWPRSLEPATITTTRSRASSCPTPRELIPRSRRARRSDRRRRHEPGSRGWCIAIPIGVLIKLVAVCAGLLPLLLSPASSVGPGSGSLSAGEFAAAVDYVRARAGIWEVILTGGDPLTLSPRRVAEATQAVAAINHVKVLRWHTRLPIAAPERVTKPMVRALMAEGKTTVIAVHANHPRELTKGARSACRRLAAEGAMLVSQSVLLKGVNDDPETLIDLMRAFVEAGVKPYYLHHGDLAPGTAHWRVSIARGQELMRLLRARLSGLATPTYMLDIPGGRGKVPIGPQWLHSGDNEQHVVTDPQGIQHVYADRLGADS